MRTAKLGFGMLCRQDYCDTLDRSFIVEVKVRQGTIVTASFTMPVKPRDASEDSLKPWRLKTA